ncbi:superoxide dismutase family protein [Pontixanthobacter gangjinensis]|uniref:Superoxide dismutase family protein n=1 Tax=Pontixanthobacter gangjinensis TaxID=1028742 RepID=A0A6I4SK66_9SPHN|nr:superoxide dismutase family protein [Pontixanthobacter gangjinensis]MXO55520.1 superoxide dismutase family protein [Pontixanthobacter gangjinensis]
MTFAKIPLALLALTFLSACAGQQVAPTGEDDAFSKTVATGTFKNANGEAIGEVQLTETTGQVRLSAKISGLTAGQRGFHLHQTGSCESPDFKSAGGHLNPLDRSHGSKSEGGSHLGDLPNLITNEAGQSMLTAKFTNHAEQVLAWIFDEDGTAVMIHAEPDDYLTDPTGAAGPRVACAVLVRP